MPDTASARTLIVTDASLNIRLVSEPGLQAVYHDGRADSSPSPIGHHLFDRLTNIPRDEAHEVCQAILAGRRFPGDSVSYRKVIANSANPLERRVVLIGPNLNACGEVDGVVYSEFNSPSGSVIPTGDAVSRRTYERLVEDAADVICLLDRQGVLTFVNRRVEHYLGLTVKGLINKHFGEIIHPDDVEAAQEMLIKVLAGQPIVDYEFRMVLPDGTIVYLVANGGVICLDGEDAVVAICRDVTESAELKQKLIARNNALGALNSIIVGLSSSSLDEGLQTALEQVLSALDLRMGMVMLKDTEGRPFIGASVGFNASVLISQKRLADKTIAQKCADIGEMVIVPDLQDESIDEEIRQIAREMGVEASVALPLRSGNSVTAVLSLAIPARTNLTIEQVEFLNLAAGILGPAIENARLHNDLEDRANRLAMIERLARSINAGRSVQAVLDSCMGEIAGLVGYDFGAVVLFGSDGEVEISIFSRGGIPQGSRKMTLGTEQMKHIADIDHPLVFHNSDQMMPFHTNPDTFTAPSGSGAVAPLVCKGELFGLLKVWANRPEGFGTREVEILQAAAEHLSIAVLNAGLYEAERAKSLELEALAKEAQHRIKNNLQMIAGLLSMPQKEARSGGKAIERCLRQVRAIATVHDLLSLKDISAKIYLDQCMAKIAGSAVIAAGRSETIDVVVGGDECMLTADAATAVGMIVNELVSNAIEHGFRDKADGRIEIRITRMNEQWIVDVSDNGCGLPSDFVMPQSGDTASGLGLVSSLAVYGLGGKLKIENAGIGTKARITF